MMTSRELKVGDEVITYDGKFKGVVSLVDNRAYFISFPDKNIPSYFYKKDTLMWEGWDSEIEEDFRIDGKEGLKYIVPLQEFNKEEEKEEIIELYLDDEDDYVD